MEELSVDELFGNLKQVVENEKDVETIEKSCNNTFETTHDMVSVMTGEDKSADFAQIEQTLKRLPKLETSFDSLATTTSSRSKVNDPIDILQARKKQSAPVSTTEKWFSLPRPEMTSSLKRDLMLIKHRAALDPKRHYKKDKWTVPDRFAVGTIIEGPTEFYSSRIPNKQRRSTMLETLMVDDNVNKYFKRKYTEIQQTKTSGKRAHYKAVKEKRRKF